MDINIQNRNVELYIKTIFLKENIDFKYLYIYNSMFTNIDILDNIEDKLIRKKLINIENIKNINYYGTNNYIK